MMVPFNYAPVGWHLCDGSLLKIVQNEALFTLLGTTYGGDGMTTFALPDLRGRVPAGFGQPVKSPSYQLGQSGPLAAVPGAGTGQSQFLGLNFIICMNGMWPSRD